MHILLRPAALPGSPPGSSFELRVVVLEVAAPLLRGAAVSLHAHAAREEGVVAELLALLDPRTGEVTKVGGGGGPHATHGPAASSHPYGTPWHGPRARERLARAASLPRP
jgi:hypothetical protein